ncbi:hypothetical protein [Streptomyces sp. NPDC088180]|uniref:hypothetical protein n=1 Tax=Streptomyces sp. NPDC088180 TaxID=3365837 RepID=UPI00383042B8
MKEIVCGGSKPASRRRADDDCCDAFYEAVEAEEGAVGGNRGPRGEQWDVRCEDEAMRELPRPSAMFPLRPLVR